MVDVLQDKARQLGVTSEDIATTLNGVVDGASVTQVRDDIYLVKVLGRANSAEGARSRPCATCNCPPTADNRCRSRRWRRSATSSNSRPSGVGQGCRPSRCRPASATACSLRPWWPSSSRRSPSSHRSSRPDTTSRWAVVSRRAVSRRRRILAVIPMMLFAMATILMVQLQSFHRLFLVFAVAPLALIGVVAALLPSGAPLGFVAILGVLALIGILIRNSVILIVQIEHLRSEANRRGKRSSRRREHRMRPILLTAAAASLALIPISREIFWGPMAYAMMGGIIVGTVLTLLFLPALYVAWFRIKAPDETSLHEWCRSQGIRGPAARGTRPDEPARSRAAPQVRRQGRNSSWAAGRQAAGASSSMNARQFRRSTRTTFNSHRNRPLRVETPHHPPSRRSASSVQ